MGRFHWRSSPRHRSPLDDSSIDAGRSGSLWLRFVSFFLSLALLVSKLILTLLFLSDLPWSLRFIFPFWAGAEVRLVPSFRSRRSFELKLTSSFSSSFVPLPLSQHHDYHHKVRFSSLPSSAPLLQTRS